MSRSFRKCADFNGLVESSHALVSALDADYSRKFSRLCFLKSSPACELLDLRRVVDRLRAGMLDLILITLSSLLSGLRGRAALQAENIALRHQLTVLQRTHTKAPSPHTRRPMSVGLVVRLWSGWRSGLIHSLFGCRRYESNFLDITGTASQPPSRFLWKRGRPRTRQQILV
jgi:hypothetical protein